MMPSIDQAFFECLYLRYKLNISTIYALQMFDKTSDLILKCAIFEEHSASCVYFRFSGTLFPVSMIDGGYIKLVP